jgi:hypothetical protein
VIACNDGRPRLTRSDMLRLFDLLNAELAAVDTHGEIYFDPERLPPKTRLALEELLPG